MCLIFLDLWVLWTTCACGTTTPGGRTTPTGSSPPSSSETFRWKKVLRVTSTMEPPGPPGDVKYWAHVKKTKFCSKPLVLLNFDQLFFELRPCWAHNWSIVPKRQGWFKNHYRANSTQLWSASELSQLLGWTSCPGFVFAYWKPICLIST